MYHANVNVNTILENENVGVIVKIRYNTLYAKIIVFGILMYVLVKMIDMQEVILKIQWLRVMKL